VKKAGALSIPFRIQADLQPRGRLESGPNESLSIPFRIQGAAGVERREEAGRVLSIPFRIQAEFLFFTHELKTC